MFELPKMAAPNDSTPMRAQFGRSSAEPEASAEALAAAAVPAILSRAQQKIVRSARRQPLTLVVGPPGTGKSYTASAVAVDRLDRRCLN